MPRKKKHPISDRKRSLLPDKGKGSDDPAVDFMMNGASTVLECAYEACACVARPLWALLCYVCYEAWLEEPAPKKARRKKKKEP